MLFGPPLVRHTAKVGQNFNNSSNADVVVTETTVRKMIQKKLCPIQITKS